IFDLSKRYYFIGGRVPASKRLGPDAVRAGRKLVTLPATRDRRRFVVAGMPRPYASAHSIGKARRCWSSQCGMALPMSEYVFGVRSPLITFQPRKFVDSEAPSVAGEPHYDDQV